MTDYDARTMKNNYLIAGVAVAVSVGLIALFGCAALVAYGKVKGKAASVGMATVQNAETEEKRDPVASLKDEVFYEQFAENIIAVETKYIGKWVKIRGFVGSSGKTPGGLYQMGMCPLHNNQNQAVSHIRFTIAPGKEKDFADVKIGLPIEIVAKVVGRQSNSSTVGGYIVVLSDAHIVQHGASVPY